MNITPLELNDLIKESPVEIVVRLATSQGAGTKVLTLLGPSSIHSFLRVYDPTKKQNLIIHYDDIVRKAP